MRLYWTDREGKEKSEIAMACMTEAQEGTKMDIFDEEAVRFRAEMIELMMLSHPHDCPVCDEGGECHLQDMTVMTGHSYRRYRGRKRTFENQDLGPFVTHELNRCITCYRCTRFYNDYAGGRDFGVFGLRNQVYFGRAESGTLESEFSGNLIEVCPTGVFDDKPFSRRYSRKWDLQTAPSVCPHCGLGCTTTLSARYGELRRVQGRFNRDVNKMFLCDRGRFGFEFVNAPQRVRTARAAAGLMGGQAGGQAAVMDGELALDAAAGLLRGRRAVGFGSPRASLEANYALRALVGPANFYLGMSDGDDRLVGAVLEIAADPSPAAGLGGRHPRRRRRPRPRRGPHQHGADARPHHPHLAAPAPQRGGGAQPHPPLERRRHHAHQAARAERPLDRDDARHQARRRRRRDAARGARRPRAPRRWRSRTRSTPRRRQCPASAPTSSRWRGAGPPP